MRRPRNGAVTKFPSPAPSGGHLLGQPFTLSNLSIPVNVTFACNCAQPPSEMQVINSAPVTCPACQKTYIVAFNPQNGQITVSLAVEHQKVPS
jgi:hypothetical protein